jgi:CheY-like chemotaxis protein
MGKKILLADDSITIQKVIELTFSDEDFEVVTVGNGRLAIEKVQEVRPDVVLCDVIMPEKDGYEVCDFIKKSPSLAQVPVLLLTGAFEPFDQERAARVGCDGFLAKPFEPETLIARVKDLLGKAARAAAASPRPAAPAPISAVESATIPPPFPAAMASPPPPLPPLGSIGGPPSLAASTPPPPAKAEEPEVAFIPDEPFEDLDAPGGASPSMTMPHAAALEEPVEELLPITSEESESLSGTGEDSSTVMFRADALPWPSPKPAPAAAASPAEDATPEVSVLDEMIDADAVVEESAPPVIMTGPRSVPPPPPAPAWGAPAPPKAPPPPATVESPRPSAEPTMPAFRPPVPPPPPPASVAEPPPAAQSFADVAAALPPEPDAGRASSVAAQVDVPIDMVSQIAQRVVAQLSEKVVERIAWEVIPDLAEALIKREIERLKAELQQLG